MYPGNKKKTAVFVRAWYYIGCVPVQHYILIPDYLIMFFYTYFMSKKVSVSVFCTLNPFHKCRLGAVTGVLLNSFVAYLLEEVNLGPFLVHMLFFTAGNAPS